MEISYGEIVDEKKAGKLSITPCHSANFFVDLQNN
jgi:hypothetical protein